MRNLLRDYHQRVCRCLKSEHKELQAAERSKRKMMESKGEIPSDKREQLEMIQCNFEKLYASTQTLSDLLNENMPELPREVEAAAEGNVLEMEESGDLELDPWGDPWERCRASATDISRRGRGRVRSRGRFRFPSSDPTALDRVLHAGD